MAAPFSLGPRTPPLGGAVPLVCAPIVAPTRLAALRQAELITLAAPAPDLVELRADHLADIELEEFATFLGDLATVLGPGLPILCTNRLSTEGGAEHWGADDRLATLHIAIASGQVALVDVELATPSTQRQELVALAHAQQVGVIISAHDFAATPADDRLDAWLADLQEAGGDGAKLAVTAQSPEDALRLLHATRRAHATASCPLITLAMGPVGTLTRLAGPFFGAALSFATVSATSAPGQLPVGLVRDYWHAAGIRKLETRETRNDAR